MSITSELRTAAVADSVVDMIGNTPLVDLSGLVPEGGGRLFAKAEFMNPGGSVKDRICRSMLQSASKQGKLHDDSVVIESTSGNTGIGLAMICSAWGLDCILTMPASMSEERIKLLRRFGAQVELSSENGGMAEAILLSESIARDLGPRAFMPQQFENPANPQAHIETTGPEILRQTDGLELAAFVAAVGTGGTLSGVGKVLKEAHQGLRVVAVEPAASPVLSGGKPGPHGIQGIGAGFIPDTLNLDIVDDICKVEESTAVAHKTKLGHRAGLHVGISAGANVAAAINVAASLKPHECVVTVLCDTGERYLSLDI